MRRAARVLSQSRLWEEDQMDRIVGEHQPSTPPAFQAKGPFYAPPQRQQQLQHHAMLVRTDRVHSPVTLSTSGHSPFNSPAASRHGASLRACPPRRCSPCPACLAPRPPQWRYSVRPTRAVPRCQPRRRPGGWQSVERKEDEGEEGEGGGRGGGGRRKRRRKRVSMQKRTAKG